MYMDNKKRKKKKKTKSEHLKMEPERYIKCTLNEYDGCVKPPESHQCAFSFVMHELL